MRSCLIEEVGSVCGLYEGVQVSSHRPHAFLLHSDILPLEIPYTKLQSRAGQLSRGLTTIATLGWELVSHMAV